MYHYIILGAILVSAAIWVIYRLVLLYMNPVRVANPSSNVNSSNTNSSISIAEVYGPKKSQGYNMNKHTEQSQNIISNATIRTKKITSNASDDSLKSRNSFGFVPSIRTVAPLTNRGKRGTQNFLMLLDSLDPIEDEEAKKRKQPKRHYTTASSSGIEANSSDETASQTLIGKELDHVNDLEAIKLDYIRLVKPK